MARPKSKPKSHAKNNAVKQHDNSKRGFQVGNNYRFKTGYDPRRNYHGRPRDIDQLRELVRDIGQNEIELKDGQKISRLYLKALEMFDSKDPRDNALVLAYGWGKVPEELNVRNLSDDEILRRTKDIVSRIGALLGGITTPRLESGNIESAIVGAETMDVSREQSANPIVDESAAAG